MLTHKPLFYVSCLQQHGTRSPTKTCNAFQYENAFFIRSHKHKLATDNTRKYSTSAWVIFVSIFLLYPFPSNFFSEWYLKLFSVSTLPWLAKTWGTVPQFFLTRHKYYFFLSPEQTKEYFLLWTKNKYIFITAFLIYSFLQNIKDELNLKREDWDTSARQVANFIRTFASFTS